MARRIGIAAPSIYAHFDGADEIVQAVVDETFRLLHARIELARQVASPGRDRLIAGCRAYVAFGTEHAALYGLLCTRARMPRPVRSSTRSPEVADLDGRGPSSC